MSEHDVPAVTNGRPVALCCCGTPLVSTFERAGYEWYCVGCKGWFGWLHARKGDGPNPTPELVERAAS